MKQSRLRKKTISVFKDMCDKYGIEGVKEESYGILKGTKDKYRVQFDVNKGELKAYIGNIEKSIEDVIGEDGYKNLTNRLRAVREEDLSVFISLILRHKPETIDIKLDKNGYAIVEELIAGINNKDKYIDMDILEKIVRDDNKGRYKFNEDKTKIRASQGHTVKVDLELKEIVPPDVLYHGTCDKFVSSIMKTGINKGVRHHVHLSGDRETASNVGNRRGKAVVLEIDALKMHKRGYKIYKSDNGVYLTDYVPVEFIRGGQVK